MGIMLLVLAINAIGGGIYGMAGAKDIPAEWLDGSPFSGYFIPSLFLFVVIGGSCLVSAMLVFGRRHMARQSSFFCGILLLAWIMIQLYIIGYVSLLQPAIAASGILILVLAKLLPSR